jgi:hypothetical protein
VEKTMPDRDAKKDTTLMRKEAEEEEEQEQGTEGQPEEERSY